jgi:hypothetical protein
MEVMLEVLLAQWLLLTSRVMVLTLDLRFWKPRWLWGELHKPTVPAFL